MPRLAISLLGPPRFSVDGVPLKISSHRAIPLLAYLATTDKAQSRESIANLLWSEGSLPQALASLRTTLWRLKAAGLDEWISLQNNEISLDQRKSIEVDVQDFRAHLEKCKTHGHPPTQVCLYCIPALTKAIELYRGEFMAGFNLSKAPAFEDWRTQEGEILHLDYINALEKLVIGHRTFGEFTQAIQYARTLLRLDAYNETAQYDLLQLYHITGQRTAAINQYKRYKTILSRDLSIEPSGELTNLYRQILSGRSTPGVSLKENTAIFLVADIEKATSLWLQPGVQKADVLNSLHGIFSETSRRFRGSLIQKSEDNITILFDKGQPLHCAVTIHLKLKKAEWGASGPPGIRMVLFSTASARNSRADFTSITRAASNLLSISWGGQVIFTEQTLPNLDLPPGSRVRDLGYHLLKDDTEPVHVYELLHPHLPGVDHPPLQSGSPQMVNFPTHTPAFIGRENELEQLNRLADTPDHRLISLIGPGGVGKTRLAVQFATQSASRFPDGAYFISLASIQAPELIPIVLADALKFTFYGPKNHTEQLGGFLHRLKVLLIFDNFEHLSSEGSNFLSFLLNQTHHLKILVTTRERLNMLAEVIIEVQGLPVPNSETQPDAESFSSVRLFLQNAHRVAPNFSHNGHLSDIINICRLVDGLPLGIILASTWVRVYRCQQIAEEIRHDINFLSISAPDLPPRHRSLRAVFDNSWELLPVSEQRLLSRLAIFQGAFTPLSAQQICSASPQVLTSLLDKSLLHFQFDRYVMLETFHQYAMAKLQVDQGEFMTTREKFIHYFSNLCQEKSIQLATARQHDALDEFKSEYENIRISWCWMVELGLWDMVSLLIQPLLMYHSMSANYLQGREMFHLALSQLDSRPDPSLALLHASLQQCEAWMTIRNGFVTKGMQNLYTCLETFRQNASQWDIYMTLMFLADASRMTGNFVQGKALVEEALKIPAQADFPPTNYVISITANCQSILGGIYLELGELEQARSFLNTSLATHQRIGTHWGSVKPLLGLGKLAYTQGEFIQARDLYLQALETATKVYDRRGMALIHNNLSATYEVTASQIEAYHHILTALRLCKETGDRRLTAVILNNLAYYQMRYLHHASEALRTYHESIENFSDLGDLRGVSFSYYDTSKAYLKVGLVEEARSYCLRSLQTAMTMDSPSLILHALHGFANVSAATGDIERALRLCSLIEHHPQVEPDTQKRAIVSRTQLEVGLAPDMIEAIQKWGIDANLQDVIDQILGEKFR